jgi:hypothetical protein
MRPQLALRDHSLVVLAPLRVLIMNAVREEKCAGGNLAQEVVEDLLPLHLLLLHLPLNLRIHLPLLEVALCVLPLVRLAVEIV